MYFALKATGRTKVELPIAKVWYQNNAPSLKINDEAYFKDKQEYIKTVTSIDTTAIKDALKDGKDFKGYAELVQGESIRIK